MRRLQAALRQLDTGPALGADIAADLGYFDQGHFVHEFRSFTAMTPTQYTQRRSWLPSHVDSLRRPEQPGLQNIQADSPSDPHD